MKQLFMKQLVSSGKDNYTIKDRRGKELYTVTLDDLEVGDFISISNCRKEPVLLVKQDEENELKKFVVYSDNQELIAVEFNDLTKECTAMSNELAIIGDLLEMTFDVMYGYRKVGKVRKRWVSSEDTYEMTIFESDRESEIIGLATVLGFAQYYKKMA
ncbi:hypothetical protein JZO82_09870 [Vagococcus fluvialis]|uniref:hypothetical protein n=1 Tax=Vagococcus fluvialis TaxID=2738 RepID=UPI001A8CFFDB|nr:hypothetical protein [Vagococcus fluvialis]MBO0429469.1 hypothetical protein [Vagococcus fluvialis]